jgi:hypothetical protein
MSRHCTAVAIAIAINPVISPLALAEIVTVDDFRTHAEGDERSSGHGILGERRVPYADALPWQPWGIGAFGNSLTIGDGVASIHHWIDAAPAKWNPYGHNYPGGGFIHQEVQYNNFGTMRLTNSTLNIYGQSSVSTSGSGIVRCWMLIEGMGGATYLNLGASTQGWQFGLGDASHLSAVTSIKLVAENYAEDGGSAHLSLSLTGIEISLVPAPATAPLLALAGLTARGRRRK